MSTIHQLPTSIADVGTPDEIGEMGMPDSNLYKALLLSSFNDCVRFRSPTFWRSLTERGRALVDGLPVPAFWRVWSPQTYWQILLIPLFIVMAVQLLETNEEP
jgi:hypothetical protein